MLSNRDFQRWLIDNQALDPYTQLDEFNDWGAQIERDLELFLED